MVDWVGVIVVGGAFGAVVAGPPPGAAVAPGAVGCGRLLLPPEMVLPVVPVPPPPVPPAPPVPPVPPPFFLLLPPLLPLFEKPELPSLGAVALPLPVPVCRLEFEPD